MDSMKDAVDSGAENTHYCMYELMARCRYATEKKAIMADMYKFTMTLHKAAYNGYFGAVKILLDQVLCRRCSPQYRWG